MTTEAAHQQVRAGCYCRISSDPKDKREGVDRQCEDTADICAINGWTPAGFYVDNDRSASNGKDRPEWDKLLADIKAGSIDAIVVWNQDRGWRKMADLESLRPLLEPRGVPLATTNIGVIDFRNADDVFRAQVSTALSEMEVAKMKVRMRRAARQRAERGIPKWPAVPFGYTVSYEPDPMEPELVRKAYEPHPVESQLVRKAYESVLGGSSLSGLAREWNKQGHVGRNGKPWSASTFSLFLRSPRNAGLRAHNDVVVGPGNWAPLVNESTWRATQGVLDDPARKPGPKTVRRHLLTGLLRCGKCADGGRIGGYQGPQGQERYRCWKCLGVAISKPDAEETIRDIVCARLARPDATELLIDREAPDLDALSAEANTIRARRIELATEFADGELTAAELRAARERLNTNLEAIEAKMSDAAAKRVFADIPLGTDRVYGAFTRLDPDRQRAIINVMMTATILPVGKRGRQPFDPERIAIEWRR